MKEIQINKITYAFDESYDEARMNACAEKLNAMAEAFLADERYRHFDLAGLLASKLIFTSALSKIAKETLAKAEKTELIVQVFNNELSLVIPRGTEDSFVGYEEEIREYYEILKEEHPEAPEAALRMNSVIIFCYNNL